MTVEEIKTAVDNGKNVHWSNSSYQVINGGKSGYLIKCVGSGYAIGLTWEDGTTLNAKESDFYIN